MANSLLQLTFQALSNNRTLVFVSPSNALAQNDIEIWVLVLDSVKHLFNHHVLASGLLQGVSCLILRLELASESIGCDVVVSLLLCLKWNCLIEWSAFLHLLSQNFIGVLLVYLLFLIEYVSVLLNLPVDVFLLPISLLDWRFKLHGVLSCVLQSLLQVCDLSW